MTIGNNGYLFQNELVAINQTTAGQGPNYVSAITITANGSGYAPQTPITFTPTSGGSGAIAVADTNYGTTGTTYQPAYGAAPGWDMATGLGTPNGLNFVCSSVWGTGGSVCVLPQTITVTTAPPSSAAYNSTFNVAATATSGLTVAFTASGACSVVDNGNGTATYTMTSGTGTCSVIMNQAGSSGYTPAPTVTDTVNATKATNTVTLSGVPASAEYGSSFTVGASGLGTGLITYTSDGVVCTNAGPIYTMIAGGGTCVVGASQAADSNYTTASASAGVTATGASSVVSVATSGSPSDYGASVMFTATLTSDAGMVKRNAGRKPMVFTGGVTWSDANGPMTCTETGSSTTPVSGYPGTATCTTTTLAVNASDTITASFAGDANHGAGSGTVAQVINPASTTTTVTSTPNPSTYATPVTFTATIGAENNLARRKNGARKPMAVTGNVTWSANTGCSSTAVVWNGTSQTATATCTTSRASSLQVGNDIVTATYAGDSNHNGSTSPDYTQVVTGGIATTIDVTNVSPASENYGLTNPVTITAVLSWVGNGVAPTAANVTIGGNGPGTYGATSCAARVHETITCTASYTPNGDGVGSYNETATFSGDTNYSASSSTETNNFTILGVSTTTAVTSTPNPSTYATPVTFTATITSATGDVARRNTHKKPMAVTGSVAWSTNTACGSTAVTWDPVALVGTATCTTSRSSSLPVGSDTVTATYGGDSNHNGSTSPDYTQTVTGGIATTIDVTGVSPASEDYAANTPATITAVLSWVGNGKAPTAANVTIGGNGPGTYGATSCAARVHETITCTATYTPSNDGVGTYNETATFSGDSIYNSSSSPETNNFAIAPATTTTSVIAAPTTSTFGQSVTFTATIGAENNFVKGRRNARKPMDVTGSVAWSGNTACGSTAVTWDPVNLVGTASCTTTSLPGGSDTVTATYAGDSNHSGSAGSASEQVNGASQTISCSGIPSSAVYNTSFTASCSASSGLPVSYSSTGSCSNANAVYTMTSGTGSCLVTATQAGNADYAAATPVNQSVTATKASQTITVTTPAPATAPKSYAFTIGASASSGLAITYGASGVCTNSGATYTMSASSGTCTETLSQAGDSNYAAATSVVEHTTGKAPVKPTVSLTGAPADAIYGDTYTVTASSTNDNAVPVIKAATTTCTVGANQVSGTTVTALVTITTGGGTCQVSATWALTNIYAAATVKATTTLTKATPTVSLTGAPATAAKGSSFTVTATSDESGSLAKAPTITGTPTSACSVGAVSSIGGGSYQATVTMKTATGTCTTKASWAATAGYAAASASETTTGTAAQ